MAFGGLGWLTFLSPPLARSLSPYNFAPGIMAEGSLILWLLVIGVAIVTWSIMIFPNLGRSSDWPTWDPWVSTKSVWVSGCSSREYERRVPNERRRGLPLQLRCG